jgi:hypothetical protein
LKSQRLLIGPGWDGLADCGRGIVQQSGFASRIVSSLERATIPSAGVSPIFAVGVTIAAFLGSIWLLLNYTTGDAWHYNHLFSSLEGTDVEKILFWQLCRTSSNEPLYGLISWAAANSGISRTALMAAANVVLIGLLATWLRRNDAPCTTWLLLFTNYYVLVLFASADRLKLAVIMLLGALLVHRTWQKGTLVTLSLITHLQSFILVGAWLAGRAPGLMANPRLRRELPLIVAAILVAVACVVVFAAYNWRQVSAKFNYYNGSSTGLLEGKDFVLLMAVGLLVSSNRPRVVLTQLPLLILAVILGDQRMTIIGVMMLFQQIVEERRTGHPLFILLMAYPAYKSIGFVENVIAFGNGFGFIAEFQPHSLALCAQLFGQ